MTNIVLRIYNLFVFVIQNNLLEHHQQSIIILRRRKQENGQLFELFNREGGAVRRVYAIQLRDSDWKWSTVNFVQLCKYQFFTVCVLKSANARNWQSNVDGHFNTFLISTCCGTSDISSLWPRSNMVQKKGGQIWMAVGP